MSGDLDELRYEIAELKRTIRNMVRFVEVETVDADRGVVTKSVDRGGGPGHDLPISTPLPWAETGAPDAEGHGTTWRPPKPKSRMMIVSPSGVIANGMMFPAGFSDQVGAPSKDPDAFVETQGKSRVEWSKDKVRLEHDGAVITLQNGVVTIQAATELVLDAPKLTVKGNVLQDGNWTQTGTHKDSHGGHK
jgi:phage baseplate assembly protein gpV